MRLNFLLGALALASGTTSQNVTYCPGNGVCYAVNIPDTTASSGSGDIFFQISGPSSMSWIGLGQGSSMKGANIFFAYANSVGTNVTLSPRLGVGDGDPSTSGTLASLTLLAGSGISNGIMTANVKCSSCKSWSGGGSMSFTDSSSKWIWAYKSGAAISSDSTSVNLEQHNKYGTTTFNLQSAAGGSTVNPFLTTSAAASSSSPSPSSGSSSGDSGLSEAESGGEEAPPSYFNAVLMAHAILAAIAFVILFPLGAIGIRALSFKGLVYLHAGWMMLTYIIILAAMGMGVWIAVITQQLDAYHSIIGLVVVAALLLQPVTGLTHHLLYKKLGRKNGATYPHIWWGRAVITVGIINGVLGLQMSDNTKNGEIAYGVVAGFMWCSWMAVIIIAFIRSRGKTEGETGEGVFDVERKNGSNRRLRSSESLQETTPPQTQRTSYSAGEEAKGLRAPRAQYR